MLTQTAAPEAEQDEQRAGREYGWGPALRLTVRELSCCPNLPRYYRASASMLDGTEADALHRWMGRALRAGRPKGKDEAKFLSAVLDAAQEWLEGRQDELDAAWSVVTTLPEFGWQDAPQAARDLYRAVMAVSRVKGAAVMLSCRVACDVMESMTGRRYESMAVTRARKWLESRGIVASEFYGASGTTVYIPLTEAVTRHYSAAGEFLVTVGGDGLRPELTARDRAVFRESVAWLKSGTGEKKWAPGRITAAVAAREMQLAERDARGYHGPDLLDPGQAEHPAVEHPEVLEPESLRELHLGPRRLADFEIAYLAGCDTNTVRRALRRHGVVRAVQESEAARGERR